MRHLLPALLLMSGACVAHAEESAPPTAGFERQEIRAQLLPQRYTTLAAEVGAKVNRLALMEGEAFKRGQLLVSFDCTVQQALLEKARAEQNAAEHTVKANHRLLELNSAGQLDVDIADATLARARAEVGAQQALLNKCAITAPFSGRIAEQKVREQQFVQAGQPLLDVIDDSVLELEFLIPSSWLAWVKPGHRFDVAIDETQRRYPARILRIGARVDPVSQSIKVVAAIDGSFPELLAGMSGRVALKPVAL